VSEEYKRVLNEWAKNLIKKNTAAGVEAHEIVNVEFTDYPASGYCDTCYSEAYTAVNITYIDSDHKERHFYDTDSGAGFEMGNILQQLFAIAEKEE
jgi:hypothetical protein